MKVKSTGLGKTQLTAHFDGFTAKEGGEASAVLIITSTEPVHWHIECDLGGNDLRSFAGQVLRPGMIWHLIKLLARGGEARGFVMEKEGGRRSRKERVTRSAAPEPTPVVDVASGNGSPVAEPAVAQQAAVAEHAVAAAAPAPRPTPARSAGQTSSSGSGDREERERRRAERRQQREEAAQQYATTG